MKGKLLNTQNTIMGRFGTLMIVRSGDERLMFCPFDPTNNTYCGDWCALFGEPYTDPELDEAVIELCRRTLVFTDFADERGEK